MGLANSSIADAAARRTPRWMGVALGLAGIYNIAWGLWAMLFPLAAFEMIGMDPPRYPQLWQCIGMIVGVYGIGYAIAAADPVRHWPIVLVGLLGKVLGPIGFLDAARSGTLPWSFGWINVANDLIWWVPFTLILVHAAKANRSPSTPALKSDEIPGDASTRVASE